MARLVASSMMVSVASAGNCDCSWTHGGSSCGASDGSQCWSECCAGPKPQPCDCSWTHGGSSCGVSDGSQCWSQCCAGPKPQPCDCSWTHGGSSCGASDGSQCWSQCCAGPKPQPCDCSWTHGGSSCGKDDGSQCWSACCSGASPTPGPVPPAPSPSPPPAPGAEWCPSAGDLTVAYGSAQLKDQGWTVYGNGAAATKAAYNLVGGFVEYDIDLSAVTPGVNANIYTISPRISGDGFQGGDYCDGAENGRPWCLEVDWIESNGNCGGATTLHTKPHDGPDGCTAWGCRANYHYNGRASFHMRIEYGTDGSWTTIRDGQVINAGTMSPAPGGFDWEVIKSTYESNGAIIYSSEWEGWVPVDDCGTSGNLGGSHFSISNLRIKGSVVQGPEPRRCGGLSASNSTVIV